MEQSTPGLTRAFPAREAALSTQVRLADALIQAVPDPARWTEQALMELFDANRREGEAYTDCFQRLGAPRYAAMLSDVAAGTAA